MIDDAFSTWRTARAAGESIVVVAPDHATVDALALRARAERVAAGEVEPDGIAVGAQVVGRGDEIVTTRNDRRLITTGGLWVRNGDRWHVDARRDDGALVVSNLDGHGRVVLPAGYAAERVALAYAVTVHKAEGITVDRAVLLADAATSAEHLYVGMTRGRSENRVCVITDAATTGHGRQRPLEPVDVLADVMRRSSAERSATETLRHELDRGEHPATLRRLWEQAPTTSKPTPARTDARNSGACNGSAQSFRPCAIWSPPSSEPSSGSTAASPAPTTTSPPPKPRSKHSPVAGVVPPPRPRRHRPDRPAD